jgi:hypothetical protein
LHRKLISLDFLPFLGDIIKIWKVTILCIIIGMMAVTVVSAKADEKNYIVKPLTENSLITKNSLSTGNLISSLAATSYYISQGQTKVHTSNIGPGINWLEVDLNWGVTSNSLALTVYSPSGANLGTYRDNSDGSVNGRIRLGIYPSQGYIEQGAWMFKVYGESVSGSQRYTINVYGH